MTRIVILGAGLTGLSTAYHLEQAGCFDYTLFEQESEIGGLCRSVTKNGFTFDYTGHFLHCNQPDMQKLITTILPPEALTTVQRKSYIYSHGVYTHYPFQSNLYGLPHNIIIECIEGFVQRKKSKKMPKKFVTWVTQNFGAGIARNFFLPYQEKIFSYPPHKLTTTWMGRFVPTTTLKDILAGALAPKRSSAGYNATFSYPKYGGIATLVKALANHIRNPIHTNYRAIKINRAKKIISFSNGHTQRYDILITTAPLKELMIMIDQPVYKKLLCTRVINNNFGLNIPLPTDKTWVYMPEKKYTLYRMGFPHAIASSTCPRGHASVYTEQSCLNTTKIDTITSIRKKNEQELYSLLNISPDVISTRITLDIPYAYVIYDQWRDRHVPEILQQLKSDSIHSIGRYGAWKYASMQEAILDGKTCAQEILSCI